MFFHPFRRKKKCVAYKGTDGDEGNDLDNHVSDDNLGSCGSVDEAQTPEEDTESLNQSLSSPGCLSGLSSLQSPSTSLASPLNLLASPSTPHEQQQQHLGISYLETQSNSLVSTNTTAAPTNVKKKSNNNNNQKSGRNSPLRHHEIKTEFDLTARSSSSSSSSSSSLGGGLHYQQQQQHMHHQQHHHHLLHLQQQQLQQQHLQHQQHELHYEKANVVRNPVGANPRDVNNPLSVNQLTKRDYINHNSPINHHHHLIGGSSPVSPGTSTMSIPSPSSSSSTISVAAAAALHLHQLQQQQQTHHHHLHQQQQFNLNHHLHGGHHFVGVQPQTNGGQGVQQSAAGRHRGGDDGGAISVT